MSIQEIEEIREKDEHRHEQNVAEVFNSTRLDARRLENLGKKRRESFFDQMNEKNEKMERKLFEEQLQDIQTLSNFFLFLNMPKSLINIIKKHILVKSKNIKPTIRFVRQNEWALTTHNRHHERGITKIEKSIYDSQNNENFCNFLKGEIKNSQFKENFMSALNGKSNFYNRKNLSAKKRSKEKFEKFIMDCDEELVCQKDGNELIKKHMNDINTLIKNFSQSKDKKIEIEYNEKESTKREYDEFVKRRKFKKKLIDFFLEKIDDPSDIVSNFKNKKKLDRVFETYSKNIS